ncbi:MAG TPA: helix-turn-helix domain-containing protein [Pseudonocardiaceae bacterium]|jgi:AcrR family transcriptional regulator|nr:helix-turn-helix domain-containing protein [Pseudonocardiaceae bacterium]
MAGAHRSEPPGEFGRGEPADRPGSHRQQADVATRTAILDAASALFVERGYLATTIEDIAVAARVETGTVYSIVGGKPQLLEAVVERFSDPRLGRAVDEYSELVDPHAIVRDAVRTNRFATEAFADFYDLIHRTVNVDEAVASGAEAAEQRLRRSLHLVALRLSELGMLRIGVPEAVDTFAYFLGHLSWRRLVVDFGWSYDDAEAWLAERIAEAVLSRGGAHR